MGNRHQIIPFFCLFGVLLSAGALLAEEEKQIGRLFSMDLDQLSELEIASATKVEDSYAATPAVVTVITAAEIEAYGYESVAEILSHVVGFVDNSDLVLHNFGLRGVNSGARSGSRVLKVMINSQTIDFRSSSQNFLDRELIPIDLIDRLEVIRGPVSALYGADAFLGVVNIVTRSPEALEELGPQLALHGERIEAAGEGFGASLTAGQKWEFFEYLAGVSLAYQDREGIELPRRSPDHQLFEQGVGGRRTSAVSDEARPISVYGQGAWTPDEENRLQLSVHFQELDSENPFADINALRETGHSRVSLRNSFARLDYERSIFDWLQARLFAAYAWGRPSGDDRVELGTDSFFFERRIGYDSIDAGLELVASLRERDTFLLAVDTHSDDYQLETFRRVDLSSGLRTEVNRPEDKTIDNTGINAQYLLQLADDWRFIFGYRFDHSAVIGDQHSWRTGAVINLPGNFVLKLLGGSSFQAPSPELLFRNAVQAGDIIGNEDLREQEATTFEVSLLAPVSSNFHVAATYFHTELDDLIRFESDFTNLFARNDVSSRIDGLELELRFSWEGLDAYATYAYQHAHLESNDSSLLELEQRPHGELYPEHSASFGASYYWEPGELRLSLNNRWVDERPASNQNVLIASSDYSLDQYLNTTLTVSTKRFSVVAGREAELRFQIRDLFDGKHVNPGFGGIELPSLGRRYQVTYEQRF